MRNWGLACRLGKNCANFFFDFRATAQLMATQKEGRKKKRCAILRAYYIYIHIPPLRFLRPSIFLIYKKATGGCAVSRRAGVVVVINALFTNIDRLALGSFHKKEEVLVYKPSFLPSFLCSTAFPASVPIPPLTRNLLVWRPSNPTKKRKKSERKRICWAYLAFNAFLDARAGKWDVLVASFVNDETANWMVKRK